MESQTMGRVVTEATIENSGQLWQAKQGQLPPDQVRRLVVSDALVDTGCTGLGLPSRFIKQLGLTKVGEKQARSAGGLIQIGLYDAVRLTIMGRSMTVDPMEVPDDLPVLIGQIPLEMLDLVPDPQACKLIGNPAHGGDQILELI